MAKILVNDLFDEMREEINRLTNELSLANQCLLLLNNYRKYLNEICINCNCDQNIKNRLEFNNFSQELESMFKTSLKPSNDICISTDLSINNAISDDKTIINEILDEQTIVNEVLDDQTIINDFPDNQSVKSDVSWTPSKASDISDNQRKMLAIENRKDEFNDDNDDDILNCLNLLVEKYEIKKLENKWFACTFPNCSFKNKKRSEIRKHLRRVHITVRLYKCKLCDKRYKRKDYLYKHYNYVHSTGNHKCEYNGCAYESSCIVYVKKHMQMVHSTDVYKCEFIGCAFETNNIINLRRHMLIHSDKKSYVCEINNCGKGFHQKCALNEHQDAIHNKELKYACNWPEL